MFLVLRHIHLVYRLIIFLTNSVCWKLNLVMHLELV